MNKTCDIAIIGGGFSGLAVLANLVRKTAAPLSILQVSRDAPDYFGPAYSTKRVEHLLNVRAEGMGLFDDDHKGFYTWAAARDGAVKPGDYLPRRLFAEFLADVRREALAEAKRKGISFEFLRAEVEDITPAKSLHIATDKGRIDARHAVLAVGNTLKAKESADDPRLVSEVWNYDYEGLKGAKDIRTVAVIGSGLTALDSMISLLNCGWQGKITCLSGSAMLPQAHPETYDAAKLDAPAHGAFTGKRLSAIMKDIRRRAKGPDWPYAIDSLRKVTQETWLALSPRDRLRLSSKYFNIWNIHRHRCAAPIRAQIDAALASGGLSMVKARCTGFTSSANGAEVAFQQDGQARVERFDLVFKCFGVNYVVANNPLLTRLIAKKLAVPADNPFGIMADAKFRVYEGPGGIIHSLGTPLFGQLFETTAVPELRAQSAAVAADIISALSQPSQSRAAAANESPGGPR